MVYLSTRYSLFKRLLKSRTHVDLHHMEPVPLSKAARFAYLRSSRCPLRCCHIHFEHARFKTILCPLRSYLGSWPSPPLDE